MDWSLKDAAAQKGRFAIVTGANSGLGFDTALGLAAKGASVVLACRDANRGEQARQRLLQAQPKARVQVMALDLGSLASVRAFCEAYAKTHSRLDVLVNNAGIMMPPYTLSADGFESQLACNYLGHFALTAQLLPLLTKTANARVVSLSSLAHNWGGIRFDDINFTKGYDRRAGYAQSKLACLMFAYELSRRLKKAGASTLSVAAHPGVTATNLANHFPRIVTALFPLVGQPAEQGALPTLYAALGADIQSGDYCGPKDWWQMRGAPVKVGSNRASRDLLAARRLWALSEQMTGLAFLSE